MNTIKSILIIGAFVALFCGAALAQSDPYGSGPYIDEITTGCDIQPEAVEARRTITDISLPSTSYPLEFTRTFQSNGGGMIDSPPGVFHTYVNDGGSIWTHSYQWEMRSALCNYPSDTTCDSSNHPKSLAVGYPDGSTVTFARSTTPPGDPYWRGGKGVQERMQIFYDTSTTGRVYLLLSDGGKVEFLFNKVITNQGFKQFNYTLSQIIDPFGRVTAIAGQPDNSVIVTEPAGRWLRYYYKHPSASEGYAADWVVYQVTASDGRAVYYNYTAQNGTKGAVFTTLTSVNYSWDSNLTSTYTYPPGSFLLSTAIDPLYSGPMWRIAYKYATPPGTYVVQIASENYFDGTTVGAAVTSLSAPPLSHTRTETRADGKTRTFTYDDYGLLKSYTDFLGHTASLGYGLAGYPSGTDGLGIPTKSLDFLQHETDITFNQFTTITTQITFPATPEDAPAGQGTVKRSYVSDSCLTDPTHCDPNNMDSNNEYYLFSATDEAGHTTYYKRDSNHRVTSISYPDGGSEAFTYTALGQVQTHTLKTGDTITYQYDGRGLMQLHYDQEHSASAPNFRYGYDSLDRLNAVTDALGSGLGDPNHTTNYTYTSRNQVNVTTLPVDPVDGIRHPITNNYNPVDGTLASVVDQLGHPTSFTYDNYRRTKTVTNPGHNTPETAYAFYGPTDSGDDYTHTDSNPTFVKSPMGKETAFVYDANHRVTNVTYANGTSDAATVSYSYDANGNVISAVSPNEQPGQRFAGQSKSVHYDERNRAYSTTDALGNVTSRTFDAYGRMASITRANGQATTFDSFDSVNRLLQKTVNESPDPAAVSKYTYYNSGLLHTFQDSHLVAISSTDSYSYIYDSLGRKQSLTYPKASPSATPTSESWHYDTAGRNDTFTNRRGFVLTNSYDNLYRRTGSSWNDGLTPSVTIGYDGASRPVSISNINAAIAWAYFNDNLLNTETSTYADNIARTVAYTYDGDGNEASISYPNNAYTFASNYTNRNQLLSLVNGSTTVITYGYDPDGNLQTRVPNNNTNSSYIYDGLDRVTHVAHALNGTTRTFDYAYDAVGNRKWVQRDSGNGDVFGYDLNDQSTSILLNVANPNTTSPGNQTVFYDAGGNRTTFQAEGLNDTYVTNPLNQYTTRDSSNAAYDLTGNMMNGFDGSGYTFDAQKRVLSATKSSNTDTFKYDGLGRQVAITRNGTVTYNIYDGWNLIGEYASGATTASSAYLYGAGGLVKNMSNNEYYYQDGAGSTSHLASSTGALNEYYRYDLQGAPLFYNAGGTPITATAYGVRNLFNGEQWYSEIGLYDLRNRFYSPDIGRFIQADPAGHAGGFNLYRYCSNNPLKNSDPMGLEGNGFGWDDSFVNNSPTLSVSQDIGIASGANAANTTDPIGTAEEFPLSAPDKQGIPTLLNPTGQVSQPGNGSGNGAGVIIGGQVGGNGNDAVPYGQPTGNSGSPGSSSSSDNANTSNANSTSTNDASQSSASSQNAARASRLETTGSLNPPAPRPRGLGLRDTTDVKKLSSFGFRGQQKADMEHFQHFLEKASWVPAITVAAPVAVGLAADLVGEAGVANLGMRARSAAVAFGRTARLSSARALIAGQMAVMGEGTAAVTVGDAETAELMTEEMWQLPP